MRFVRKKNVSKIRDLVVGHIDDVGLSKEGKAARPVTGALLPSEGRCDCTMH